MAGLKHASIGLAGAAVVAALVMRLRPYQHRPMRTSQDPTERDFVLCETAYGEPCARQEPTRWLVDFYGPLRNRALQVQASGRGPVVVHVGASNFIDDVVEYRPLLHSINGAAPVRLVLVEPEPAHKETLNNAHMRLVLSPQQVTVVSAAMNKSCSEEVVQYTFSQRMFDDFLSAEPVSTQKGVASALKSWRSFDKTRLIAPLIGLSQEASYSTGEGSSETFDFFHQIVVPWVKRIYQAGNYSEYIVEERIPCLNVPALMKEAKMEPSDIVMLTVDAEGFDIPILEAFVGMPGFKPTLQRWEGYLKKVGDQLNPGDVVAWFRSQGYKMGETGHSHSKDVVAYFGPPV